MIKAITTTTCPFCGKQHEYIMACHTEKQAEAWKKMMEDFAGAFCDCDTTPLQTAAPQSREQMAKEYYAVYFRKQTKLYTVKCVYTSLTYDFTLPNAKGNYLTLTFGLDFCEDGQTNLFCWIVARNASNRLVTFDAPCEEFDADECGYSREIKDVFLSRQNLDRIATECYRKFIEAGGKNERNN